MEEKEEFLNYELLSNFEFISNKTLMRYNILSPKMCVLYVWNLKYHEIIDKN